MPEAVAAIQREHRSLTAVVSALEHLARDAAAGGRLDYELLTLILDYVEAFPDRLHHPKEDRYLFSAVRARRDAAARILDELEEEHRRGDQLTRELRYLLTPCRVGGAGAEQAFAAAVRCYAEFHRAHMRKASSAAEMPGAASERPTSPRCWTSRSSRYHTGDRYRGVRATRPGWPARRRAGCPGI